MDSPHGLAGVVIDDDVMQTMTQAPGDKDIGTRAPRVNEIQDGPQTGGAATAPAAAVAVAAAATVGRLVNQPEG